MGLGPKIFQESSFITLQNSEPDDYSGLLVVKEHW
jgi:hypothetical protein